MGSDRTGLPTRLQPPSTSLFSSLCSRPSCSVHPLNSRPTHRPSIIVFFAGSVAAPDGRRSCFTLADSLRPTTPSVQLRCSFSDHRERTKNTSTIDRKTRIVEITTKFLVSPARSPTVLSRRPGRTVRAAISTLPRRGPIDCTRDTVRRCTSTRRAR
jgi:hypothetical protein